MPASSCGYVPRPLNRLQTSFHFATFIWNCLVGCLTCPRFSRGPSPIHTVRRRLQALVGQQQITISASQGSLDVNSARSCARVTGCRITKVPAAPMLTASRCLSCLVSVERPKIESVANVTPAQLRRAPG